jgi:DNA-binding CsgD family transcriptional regulator
LDLAERNTDMFALRRQGCTVAEIALQFGLSASQVWQIVKAARERRVYRRSKPYTPKSNPRHDEMVALWKQGRTQSEIGKQFGVSRQRVQQVLNKAGCTGHTREPRRPRPQRKAPEIRAAATARRQEILSLRRLGYTGSEIASKVGVSVTYANRVSKRAG